MSEAYTNRQVVKRLLHPHTGLQALGYGKRGPIWPVMGGAPKEGEEGGDQEEDESEEEEETDEDEEEEEGEKAKKKAKKKTETEDDDERVYTAAEYNRVKARMQAADRRATDTEKRLKALEDKDKPADVKLKTQLEESLKELESTKEARKKNLIQLAFLRANDVEWYDPDDALTMADLSDVEIDDEGIVDRKALKAALKDLAKRKPHLVKTRESKEDEEEETEEEEDQRSKSSGNKMSGSRKGLKSKSPSREDLAKKYPALRRR